MKIFKVEFFSFIELLHGTLGAFYAVAPGSNSGSARCQVRLAGTKIRLFTKCFPAIGTSDLQTTFRSHAYGIRFEIREC